MMGIGFPELMVILIIIMIIFGAGKLPEIGSAFGRSIKNFKGSMKEAEAEDLPVEGDSENQEVVTKTENTLKIRLLIKFCLKKTYMVANPSIAISPSQRPI